jgi:two-component system LytT family response regulator
MFSVDAALSVTPKPRPSVGDLHVVIADASAAARQRLRGILASRPGVRIVAECTDGLQAFEAIARLRPHLAFLDVPLPHLDAFALCGRLGDLAPRVVFVTASGEHAARAFDLPALDYILKPFTDPRLFAAVDRAREEIGRSKTVRTLLREIQGRGSELLVVRSRGSRLHLLPLHEIVWVESHGTFVSIYTNERSHMTSSSIGEMEARLPTERFMRVNREAILNLAQVDEVRKTRNDFELVLLDGTVLPLGRRYRKTFEERISRGRLAFET